MYFSIKKPTDPGVYAWKTVLIGPVSMMLCNIIKDKNIFYVNFNVNNAHFNYIALDSIDYQIYWAKISDRGVVM